MQFTRIVSGSDLFFLLPLSLFIFSLGVCLIFLIFFFLHLCFPFFFRFIFSVIAKKNEARERCNPENATTLRDSVCEKQPVCRRRGGGRCLLKQRRMSTLDGCRLTFYLYYLFSPLLFRSRHKSVSRGLTESHSGVEAKSRCNNFEFKTRNSGILSAYYAQLILLAKGYRKMIDVLEQIARAVLYQCCITIWGSLQPTLNDFHPIFASLDNLYGKVI